jgi:hypothetical protein
MNMPNRYERRRVGWFLALGLLAFASAAAAQPCCECRCPRNEARACSAAFGVDDDAYLEAVCEPLGCSIAVCTTRPCNQSNRCPRDEIGRCTDGFDNDADGRFDCADADCSGDAACSGNPTPTTPSGGSPGASATPTSRTPPPTSPTGTSMTPTVTTPLPGSPSPATTPTNTPSPPAPTVTPTATLTPETDCCSGHETSPGCGIRNCQTCVCRKDDFCCDAIWDVNCANLAATECQNLCRCEDLPTPTVTPTATRTGTPQVASDCCIGRPESQGGGCSVPTCERCVCDVDDFCCDEFWDGSCGDIANDDCADTCACDAVPTGPVPPTATPTRTGSPGTPTATKTPGTPGAQTPTRNPSRNPNATQTRRPCTTNDDCERGQICNSAGRCIGQPVTPSSGGGGGGGSCNLQSPAVPALASWLWLALPAAIAALRRRRRTNGGSPR